MRILQVSDGYPPATGGLERVVQGLAAELAARGHDVDVATLSYPGAPALEQEGPVTVHRLEGWTRHLQRFSADPGHHFHPTAADPQLVRRLQRLVDELRPDVVHVHGWILHSALNLALPPGSALVVTLHDYGVTCARKTMIHNDELDRTCSGPSLRRCLPCANRFYGPVKGVALTIGLAHAQHLLDRVAMFLPISDAVARACLSGVDPARVTVVPSSVADDVAAISVAAPDFLPDGDFVLFVGALGEHKGVGLLAEAHRRMATAVPLVVVGSRRADTPDLPGTAERPVILRAGVPHEEIMAAFAAAAVVAVPSRWPEPQGLVAIEAMAAGVPVVASRVGGLAELVAPEETGLLVEPGDADALAAALDRLLGDPALRARMGTAGAARARNYTASAVVPLVEDAYGRALSGARRAPAHTLRTTPPTSGRPDRTSRPTVPDS